MALVSSGVNAVLDKVIANIRANVDLNAVLRDVTRKEFPLCDDFPSCNVNASGTGDDVGILGMGRKQRIIRVQVYVVLNQQQLELMDPNLWDLVDTLRVVLESDRYLGVVNAGALLESPILDVSVRPIPSPVGTNYVGARVLEFEARLRENLL